MLVRHFMTREVLTVKEGMRCRQALNLFRENGIRRAPVLRGEKVVAMVSLSDLLRILPGSVSELGTRSGAANECSIVAQVMSGKPVTLDPEEHLEDAARKMLEHGVGGLPVVHDGKLEGLLTESDIFRAFVGLAAPQGELRLSFTRGAGRGQAPDPVRIAMGLGFAVRGYLVHDSPGGEAISLMRLLGERTQELVTALVQAGYCVIEVDDARPAGESRPAA